MTIAETSTEPSALGIFWMLVICLLAIACALGLLWYILRPLIKNSQRHNGDKETPPPPPRPRTNETAAPRTNFAEPAPPPKPRGLNLDDVNKPLQPTIPAGSPPPKKPAQTVQEPSVTLAEPERPGEFQKTMAEAGQRMDKLLEQSQELIRQLKLAEKAKVDKQVELNAATKELTEQLELKDAQISKLEALVDRKSTFPSLRSLVEVKKLCLDMLGSQKELSREEIVRFIVADIESKLANLDVNSVDFPVGMPLKEIPPEQVEVDPRQVATPVPADHNRVAQLLRPCYYLERDSKRMVVAKALVVLYRHTPPTTPTQPNPEPSA